MTTRRTIYGKKLLVVTASIAALGFAACGDDDGTTDGSVEMDAMEQDAPIANLLPPPEDASLDTNDDVIDMDAMEIDAPIANLLPPPEDSGADTQDDVIDMDAMEIDAPIANLLPPPDSSAG